MRFIAKSILKGNITPPASKSELHRVLFLCSFANDFIQINNVYYSHDVLSTINCLTPFCDIIKSDTSLKIKKKSYDDIFYEFEILESGTTLRFFLFYCAVRGIKAKIKVSDKLLSRNILGYEEVFKDNDVFFKVENNIIYIDGKIHKDKFIISTDISSQYASAMLLFLPSLSYNSTLYLEGNLESYLYVDLTLSILKLFNFNVSKVSKREFNISPSTVSISSFNISSSWSEAANLISLNLLGADLNINNLYSNSLQGDKKYLNFISDLGFTIDSNYKLVSHTSREAIIDLKHNPDLFMPLLPLAVYNNKKTIFNNISRLKYKESNRIESCVVVLDDLGVNYEITDNQLTLYESNLSLNKYLEINSFNDHRICFMAVIFSFLGFNVVLKGSEAVAKSYPDYFNILESLGLYTIKLDLSLLREKIDSIDNKLINLLNERFLIGCLAKVVKNQLGLATKDQIREIEVLKRYSDFNNDPNFLVIINQLLLYSKELQDEKLKTFLYHWSTFRTH